MARKSPLASRLSKPKKSPYSRFSDYTWNTGPFQKVSPPWADPVKNNDPYGVQRGRRPTTWQHEQWGDPFAIPGARKKKRYGRPLQKTYPATPQRSWA